MIGFEPPSFFPVMESGTVEISYTNYFDIKKVDHEKVSICFWGEKGESNCWTKIMLILNLGEIKLVIIKSSKRTIWSWFKKSSYKKRGKQRWDFQEQWILAKLVLMLRQLTYAVKLSQAVLRDLGSSTLKSLWCATQAISQCAHLLMYRERRLKAKRTW